MLRASLNHTFLGRLRTARYALALLTPVSKTISRKDRPAWNRSEACIRETGLR
jgi:hypothetical protein